MKRLFVWLASVSICAAQTVSIGPFATEDWVDERLQVLTNDFATVPYVDDAVGEVEDKIPDVSIYATKSYVNAVSNAIPDISGLATKEYVDAVSNAIPDVSTFSTVEYVNTTSNNLALLIDDLVSEEELGSSVSNIVPGWALVPVPPVTAEVDPAFTNWLATTNSATVQYVDAHKWDWATQVTNAPGFVKKSGDIMTGNLTIDPLDDSGSGPAIKVMWSNSMSSKYTMLENDDLIYGDLNGSSYNIRFQDKSGTMALNEDVVAIIPAWTRSSAVSYTAGDLVLYNSKLYKAKQNIAAYQAWNASNWEEVKIASELRSKADTSWVNNHKWDWSTQVTNSDFVATFSKENQYVLNNNNTGSSIDLLAAHNISVDQSGELVVDSLMSFSVQDASIYARGINYYPGQYMALSPNGLYDESGNEPYFRKNSGSNNSLTWDSVGNLMLDNGYFQMGSTAYSSSDVYVNGNSLEWPTDTNGVIALEGYVDGHKWDWSTQITNPPAFPTYSDTTLTLGSNEYDLAGFANYQGVTNVVKAITNLADRIVSGSNEAYVNSSGVYYKYPDGYTLPVTLSFNTDAEYVKVGSEMFPSNYTVVINAAVQGQMSPPIPAVLEGISTDGKWKLLTTNGSGYIYYVDGSSLYQIFRLEGLESNYFSITLEPDVEAPPISPDPVVSLTRTRKYSSQKLATEYYVDSQIDLCARPTILQEDNAVKLRWGSGVYREVYFPYYNDPSQFPQASQGAITTNENGSVNVARVSSNSVFGNDNFVFGNNNFVFGDNVTVFGGGNMVTNSSGAAVLGHANHTVKDSDSSIVSGNGSNNLESSPNSIITGVGGTTARNSGSSFVLSGGGGSVNNSPNATFLAPTGTDVYNSQNIIIGGYHHNVVSNAPYSVVLGGLTVVTNQYVFMWNGGYGQYADHGPRTFNVNPVGGIEGFWIGETNLATIIQNAGGGQPTLSPDAIAPAWQHGSYTNGDFVIYNTHLYECTNITSGAWTPADWKQTSIAEMMGNLRRIFDEINGEAL